MDWDTTAKRFDEIKKIPMVFILGKERSGTTLLQTFVGGHPNIIAPPESEFIVLLYPKFGKIKKWTEKNILDFIEELYKELWIIKMWRIDRESLTTLLLSIKDDADYASLCKVIYYCMGNGKEKVLWLADKNPIYMLFSNTLLKIFPDAKFIHLVRDPRDNVYSHRKSFGGGNVGFISQKWLAYNYITEKDKIKKPERYFTLSYEKMVEAPETSMQNLCKFLGISYHEKMVKNTFPEFLKTFGKQHLILEKAKELHHSLLQPVNISHIGKWNNMSSEDIKIIEKITGDFAKKIFNYGMGEHSGEISAIANIKVFKSKIIYRSWQLFTRMRYRNYTLNRFYRKMNLLLGREPGIFDKTLRES